ncbi:thioredoxin family protein [Candidatus Latescibacterota bacterium]
MIITTGKHSRPLGIPGEKELAVEGVKDYGIRYYGIPAGYEFTSLIEDIVDVSRRSSSLSEQTRNQLKTISEPVHIQVFVSLTCPYCPPAVRLAHALALECEYYRANMIEISEFVQLAQKYKVLSVPKTVINEKINIEGALPESAFVAKVMEATGD